MVSAMRRVSPSDDDGGGDGWGKRRRERRWWKRDYAGCIWMWMCGRGSCF
jgi:hypothetical protein